MIKDAGGKDARCMASSAIFGGGHMVRRLTYCVNAVMAGFTQLVYDARDSVVETLSPGKCTGIVAHATIGSCCGVICYFTRRVSAVVTGITSTSDATMVENDSQKTSGDMTQMTGTVGGYMPFLFASGYYAVVADLAILGYARVVITAVCFQFQKTGGIVTVVAFGIG